MSLDRYVSLLSAYARQYGGVQGDFTEVLELEVHRQRIRLQFEPCDADPGEAQLLARIDVAQLSDVPSATVSRMLLQANACWSGIHGGALGLRCSDVVMLSVSQRIASLDADGLAALLQSMAQDARRWKACLNVTVPALLLQPSLAALV